MRHRLSTLAQRWQCIDAGGAGIGEVFGRPSFIGWHPVFQCFLVWSLGWSEKELTSPVGQHIVVFGLLVPMSSQAGKELPSWRPIAPFASRCPSCSLLGSRCRWSVQTLLISVFLVSNPSVSQTFPISVGRPSLPETDGICERRFCLWGPLQKSPVPLRGGDWFGVKVPGRHARAFSL